EILIAVDLLDRRGRHLANGAFYCGNGLTARKVNEMTPREIDSVQRLVPPRNFAINGYQRAPFNMVFISPPPGITHLRTAVAKAVMKKNAQPQQNRASLLTEMRSRHSARVRICPR